MTVEYEVEKKYDTPEIRDRCGQYLISVLASFLQGRKIPVRPRKLPWEGIFEMAKFHGLESMAYAALEEQLVQEKELAEKWKGIMEQNFVQSLNQTEECKKLAEIFAKEGVKVLPLKGCILKQVYPRPDFRQMSDLDLLVPGEQSGQARNILESLGYQAMRFEERYHDEYKKPPNLYVEIHKSLLPEDNAHFCYYNDSIWARLQKDPLWPGAFRMTPEDFYIYQIVHFKKHYDTRGSGIRSILDLYVYWREYGKKIDWDYVRKELDALGLLEFEKTASLLSQYWFGGKYKPGNEKRVRDMARECITGGMYGSLDFRVTRQLYYYKNKGGLLNKIRFIFRRILATRKELEPLYPWLKSYPYMAPVCRLHRLCKTLFFNRKKILWELRMLFRREQG